MLKTEYFRRILLRNAQSFSNLAGKPVGTLIDELLNYWRGHDKRDLFTLILIYSSPFYAVPYNIKKLKRI